MNFNHSVGVLQSTNISNSKLNFQCINIIQSTIETSIPKLNNSNAKPSTHFNLFYIYISLSIVVYSTRLYAFYSSHLMNATNFPEIDKRCAHYCVCGIHFWPITRTQFGCEQFHRNSLEPQKHKRKKKLGQQTFVAATSARLWRASGLLLNRFDI